MTAAVAAALAPVAALVPPQLVQALIFCTSCWSAIPAKYAFVGHALFCTTAAKEFRDRFMVHFWLTFLWGNGGGVTTALLLMSPERAPLSFFAQNYVLVSWLACWWLVNYLPGGFVYDAISNNLLLRVVTKGCTSLARAQLIVSRVNLAVLLFPGVVGAPLVLGTLAGCGGRLLADCILSGWQALPGLAELTSPGFISRSAAVAAAAHYGLSHVTGLLPPEASGGLVVTALMLHSFATELTGLPLDFTAPLSELLHKLTLVPLPPKQPQPAPLVVLSRAFTSPAAGKKAAAGRPSLAAKGRSPAAAAAPAPAHAEPAFCEATTAPPPHAASPGTARRSRRRAATATASEADDHPGSTADAAASSLAATRPRRTTRRTAVAAAAYS